MSLLDSLLLTASQDLQSGHGTAPASRNYTPAQDRKGRLQRSLETKDTEGLREAETASQGQTLAFQSKGNVTGTMGFEVPSACHSAAHDPGTGVEVCLYRDPGPVLHSEVFRDHRGPVWPNRTAGGSGWEAGPHEATGNAASATTHVQ